MIPNRYLTFLISNSLKFLTPIPRIHHHLLHFRRGDIPADNAQDIIIIVEVNIPLKNQRVNIQRWRGFFHPVVIGKIGFKNKDFHLIKQYAVKL